MELFKKGNSKFYWYDFTVASKRYRGSTKEGNETRATKIAALKLTEVIEGRNPLPEKPPTLLEFSRRFLELVNVTKQEEKTKVYYRTGCRLLLETDIAGTRLDQITADVASALTFSHSSSNANCGLRTLRRMLHKAEEWKLIRRAPKIKLRKEYGRSRRLDEEAETKLLAGASACQWRRAVFSFSKMSSC